MIQALGFTIVFYLLYIRRISWCLVDAYKVVLFYARVAEAYQLK